MMTLLMTLLSTAMLCAQTVTKRGVVYTLIGDHYEATAFDAASALADNWQDSIIIADAIDDIPVTAIAANAFDGTLYPQCANNAKTIVLGTNIQTVADMGFYLCRQVTEVRGGASVQTIGIKAFQGCNTLSGFTFSSALTSIGNAAFLNCAALRSLTFLSGNVRIQVSAFSGCSALQEITFLSTPPQLEATSFYNVGTKSTPVQVVVPVGQLTAYLEKMDGSGESYSWLTGRGWMSLRTMTEGLEYQVIRGTSTPQSTLRIIAVDTLSLINKGDIEVTAYLIQAPAEVEGYRVTDISDAPFLTGCDSLIYAIDLRQVPLKDIEVSRTSGYFAGIHPQTLIYLPADNYSEENNVVVGGRVTTALTIGSDTLPAIAITTGEATYLLNQYYTRRLLGQQIGTEAAPVPMADADRQHVWRVDFNNDSIHQYRYANSGGTVSLPTATELDFTAGTTVSFYQDGWITRRFTESTPISKDTKVLAYPQATSLTINKTSATLMMSTTEHQRVVELKAVAQPTQSRQEVTWSSADEKIATVNSYGMVQGLSVGTTVITATSIDNPNLKVSCQITIIPRVDHIELTENAVTMHRSVTETAVHQLKALVYPAGAIHDLVWMSQDTTVCKVDANGLVSAVNEGSTAVVVSPVDGGDMMAYCYVTVVPSVSGVWCNRTGYALQADEQVTLQTIVLPTTYAPQQVQWTSSDPAIASVSADGVVTGHQTGIATMTATSVARPEYSTTCDITVVGPGITTTIQGITYQITTLSDDTRQVAVVQLSDSLQQQGGEHTFAKKINFARTDFDITEIAESAFGQLRDNTLYYVPSNIAYHGNADNVVVATESGATCSRLIINEDYGFTTSHTFTADEVVAKRSHYERQWAFAFSMPISVKSTDEIRFFEMTQQDGDTLVCYEVTETEPYKPYIAYATADEVELGGKNITVTPYKRNTDVYIGDVQFMATMRQLDNSYLSGIGAFHLFDRSWLPVTEQTIIRPMTAWLASTHQNLGIRLLDSKNNAVTTAIRSLGSRISAADTPIYDLSGRKVCDSLDNLPKDIYIRGGKKIIKR